MIRTPGIPSGARPTSRPNVVVSGPVYVSMRPRVDITGRPNAYRFAEPALQTVSRFQGRVREDSLAARARRLATPLPVSPVGSTFPSSTPYSGPVDAPTINPPVTLTPPTLTVTPGIVQAPAGSFASVADTNIPLTMGERLDKADTLPPLSSTSSDPTKPASSSWLPLAAAAFVAYMVLRH